MESENIASKSRVLLKEGMRKSSTGRFLLIISIALFTGAFLFLSFAVRRELADQKELKTIVELSKSQNGNVATARQIYSVMQAVGKQTQLPNAELPIFATVTDATKLANQPLLQYVRNGDQILFYASTQKLYVYRPSTGELVAQGPFSIPTAVPASKPVTPPPDASKEAVMAQ